MSETDERIWFEADTGDGLLRRVIVGDVAIVATFDLVAVTGSEPAWEPILRDVAKAARLVRDAAAQVGRLAPVIVLIATSNEGDHFSHLQRRVRDQDWHLGDFRAVVVGARDQERRDDWENLARFGLESFPLGNMRLPSGDAAYMTRLERTMLPHDSPELKALYGAVLAHLGGDDGAVGAWVEGAPTALEGEG